MSYFPCLLLFALVLIDFYPVLSGRLILIERDLSTYFLPPRFLWVKLARSFTFPFWNPHNFSGIPLLATLQPGVLYPPHLLYLFLPFNVAWNWLIILHYLFSALTTYLLMRHLGARPAGSLAGASAFLFSGYLLSLHSLITHLFAVSWFPLVLLYFLKYLEVSRPRYLVLASFCLCMLFLAGAPEILFITLLTLLLVAIFGSGFVKATFGRLKGLRSFCLLIILFGLLSAVQTLPFLELKSMSIREGGLSYREATLWSFGFRDFIQFFVNDAFGAFYNLDRYWQNQAWLQSVYTGLIPFILSLFFFLSKDRRRPLFLALMLLSLLLSLGGSTPLYRLLYHVPPFDAIRYPVKFLFLFVFILALTTGLGLDRLRQGGEAGDSRTRTAVRALFFAGLILGLLWAFINLFHGQAYHFLDGKGFKPEAYNVLEVNLHNVSRFFLFSFLFCLWLSVTFRKHGSALLFGSICLLVFDLFLTNFGNFLTTPWQTYIRPPPLSADLSQTASGGRYFVDQSASEELYAFPQNRAAMAPTYAGLFNLYTVGGSEVMKVANHEAFQKMIEESSSLGAASRLFGAAGIRHVISLKRLNDGRFRQVRSIVAETAKSKNKVRVRLYEYRAFPGRLFLVGRARFLASDSALAKALKSESTDLQREVLLSGRGASVEDKGPVSGRADFTAYSPNRVKIRYSADRDCFLYVSDTFYPGWRAYVDGKRTSVYRADLAFRAIRVPKGSHEVLFHYVPLPFYGGLALTLLGVVLSVFWIRREAQVARRKKG